MKYLTILLLSLATLHCGGPTQQTTPEPSQQAESTLEQIPSWVIGVYVAAGDLLAEADLQIQAFDMIMSRYPGLVAQEDLEKLYDGQAVLHDFIVEGQNGRLRISNADLQRIIQVQVELQNTRRLLEAVYERLGFELIDPPERHDIRDHIYIHSFDTIT